MANGIIQAAEIEEELHLSPVITVEGEGMMDAIKEFEENIGAIEHHFNLFYKEFLMGRGTSAGGKRFLRRSQLIKYVEKRLKTLDRDAWEASIDRVCLPESETQLPGRRSIPSRPLRKPSEANTGRTWTSRIPQMWVAGPVDMQVARTLPSPLHRGWPFLKCATPMHPGTGRITFSPSKSATKSWPRPRRPSKSQNALAQKEKNAAREASEIVRRMLHKLPSMVVICDMNLKIIQTNEQFYRLAW